MVVFVLDPDDPTEPPFREFSYHNSFTKFADNIKSMLEELEKAYKKEKDHKVRTRMIAVRMVRARNISVDETADILIRCPNWVRNWLRRYDEGGLEGLRDLPRCGRPRRITRDAMDAIVANVAGCRITPVGMQQYIRAQTGTSLHITYVRKIMHLYNLTPKVAQKIHINRADRKAIWNWRYYLKRTHSGRQGYLVKIIRTISLQLCIDTF